MAPSKMSVNHCRNIMTDDLYIQWMFEHPPRYPNAISPGSVAHFS